MIFVFVERFDTGILRQSTSLHLSSDAGHLEVCRFLVEKGADMHAKAKGYDAQLILT